VSSFDHVHHVLSVRAEIEVPKVDATMVAATTVARMQHVKGPGVPVTGCPRGARHLHDLTLEQDTVAFLPTLEEHAIVGRTGRSFEKCVTDRPVLTTHPQPDHRAVRLNLLVMQVAPAVRLMRQGTLREVTPPARYRSLMANTC
jgi:hypothetical protein